MSPQIKKNDRNILIFNNRYNNDDTSKDINNNLNLDSIRNSTIFKNKISFPNNSNLEELNTIKINTLNNSEKKNNFKKGDNIIKNEKIEVINIDNSIFNKEEINSFDIKDILDDNNNNLYIHFYRLKEDFFLLYNNNYLRNIKDELLKLEIELFLEKIIELINEYHSRINEEKNLYIDLVNTNKSNKKQYIIIYKLFNKLQTIKEQKNINLKNIQIEFNNIKTNNLLISRNEIILFQNFFKNKKKVYENNYNKSNENSKIITKMIKNILVKILNQNNNKEKVSDNEKYKKWIKDNVFEDFLYNNNFVNNKIKKKHIKIQFKLDKK